MTTLPTPVHDELFENPTGIVEISIVYLADEIEKFGFTVEDATQTGVLIRLCFQSKNLNGRMTINRSTKKFNIEANGSAGCFLPTNGEWHDMRIYLAQLQRAIGKDDAE